MEITIVGIELLENKVCLPSVVVYQFHGYEYNSVLFY